MRARGLGHGVSGYDGRRRQPASRKAPGGDFPGLIPRALLREPDDPPACRLVHLGVLVRPNQGEARRARPAGGRPGGAGALGRPAVAVLRLAVSLAVFTPLFRPLRMGAAPVLRLALIGAVQFGATYVLYQRSYAHLHAYEIALFTITTPIFVALIDSAVERRWRRRYYAAAALSVAGAGVAVWRSVGDSGILGGFMLVQLSNLCFAGGQVAWRRERSRLPLELSD